MVKIFFVSRDGQAPYIVKYLNNKVYMFDKEWATTSIMETRNKHSNKSLSKTNICTMLLKITSKNMHNVVIWVIKHLEIFEIGNKIYDIINFWKNNFIIEADFDSSFVDFKLASENWSSEKSTRSCLYFIKLYSSPKTFVNLVQIYCLVN